MIKRIFVILLTFSMTHINCFALQYSTVPPKIGVVVHGLHKSGTMFIYRFFQDFCNQKHIAFFSENSNTLHLLDPTNINESFVIAPFRAFNEPFPMNIKSMDFEHVDKIYHIYHVRDPRDILVSQYFSYGWVHKIPKNRDAFLDQREWILSHTLDEYAIAFADNLKSKMSTFIQKLGNLKENEIIVKYEDMVLDFETWVSQVLTPFSLENSDIANTLYNKYVKEFNVTKEKLQHKRKVTPGDHKDKLKPETINFLNELFKHELEALNYN